MKSRQILLSYKDCSIIGADNTISSYHTILLTLFLQRVLKEFYQIGIDLNNHLSTSWFDFGDLSFYPYMSIMLFCSLGNSWSAFISVWSVYISEKLVIIITTWNIITDKPVIATCTRSYWRIGQLTHSVAHKDNINHWIPELSSIAAYSVSCDTDGRYYLLWQRYSLL